MQDPSLSWQDIDTSGHRRGVVSLIFTLFFVTFLGSVLPVLAGSKIIVQVIP